MTDIYEPVPMTLEVIQYNGKNLIEVKEFIARQQPPGGMSIVGTAPQFVRRSGRPDLPLVPGWWFALETDGWLHYISDRSFARTYRKIH